MHYQSKQDLASAYFPDRSKESAGKLLAREINLTPGLLDALRPTGNPERELSTAEKINLSEEPPRPETPLPPPTPNPLFLPRRTLTLEEVMNTFKRKHFSEYREPNSAESY